MISGDPVGVGRAGEGCKARGAKRVIPLNVSGAFHSPLMAPAVDGLREALAEATFADPSFPVIANASGETVRTGVDAKRLLADQLTAPVRWVACMQAAAELCPGATFVEIGPGGGAVRSAQADRAGVPSRSRWEPRTKWRGSSGERD